MRRPGDGDLETFSQYLLSNSKYITNSNYFHFKYGYKFSLDRTPENNKKFSFILYFSRLALPLQTKIKG
jgi:hypothetical protein